MMLSGVIFDSKNLKVLQPIVVLNSVSVMDVLSGREASAQMALHDDTVLKLEVSADSYGDVPITSHKPSRVLDASSALH